MRSFAYLCCGALTLSITSTSEQVKQDGNQTESIWGVTVEWQPKKGREFEEKIGRDIGTRAVFVHWGNENKFPWETAETLKPRPLTIFWEAKDYSVEGFEQKQFSYQEILKGTWNDYIKSFAKEIKDYGGPVILIPFSEMNGNWSPWSGTLNGNSPALHKDAYRHLHQIFKQLEVKNVKWGWAVNNVSEPNTDANAIEKYYPGDAFVDYVGVDGFNFGGKKKWLTFEDVFKESLMVLKKYPKPCWIFSFGCGPGPKKAEWISDAIGVQMKRYQITGWIYFNLKKEGDWEADWTVENDPTVLQAFRGALPPLVIYNR